MKRITLFLLMGIVAVLSANNNPVVSNVTAEQRSDGSFIVDVYYDVSDVDGDELNVTMQVSADDGATWIVSCNAITGDIGQNIYSGSGKHIVWNIGSEHPNTNMDFRFKIVAADGVGDGMWAHIPAGSYTWGSNDQIMIIDYDYDIMKYNVTNAEYAQYLTEALANGDVTITGGNVQGYYPGDANTSAGNKEFYDLGIPTSGINYGRISYNGSEFVINGTNGGSFEDHPVTEVTYFGAWAYAQHYGYRIPTEQEWEKAARGMTGYDFPYGNSLSSNRINYSGSGDQWDNGTTPVGYYNGQNGGTTDSPSPYGVYDMSGNVNEWTDSWYNNNYRVLRGGNYHNHYSAYELRSWYRIYYGYSPSTSHYAFGFRCARTP